MFHRFVTTTCLLCLTACASVVEGSSQKISLTTNPNMSAACSLSNERGRWKTDSTPATVEVKRSKTDLKIVCDSPTHKGELVQSSDMESWGGANVLAGGIIGAGVDASTGALFSYDDSITVPMTPKPSAIDMSGFSTTPNVSSYGTVPAVAPLAPQLAQPSASGYQAPQPQNIAPTPAPANKSIIMPPKQF